MAAPCPPKYRQAVEGMEPKEAIAYLLDCLDTRADGLSGPPPHEVLGLDLTRTEGRLFDGLHYQIGFTVSRVALYNQMYFDAMDADGLPAPKCVDIHLHHLRQKLKDQGTRFHIETVWGRGYRMLEAE